MRVVETLIALALTLEVILIDLQAVRHTTSHFNLTTGFDKAIFAVMEIGIAVLWVASIILTIATFRTRYKTPRGRSPCVTGCCWPCSARNRRLYGYTIEYPNGSLEGNPRNADLGSHTVGGPDGGAGLPFVGWSTQYGDVRVAHFIGLHGLQFLAMLALVLEHRRVQQDKAARILYAALFSYGTLFLITLAEALLKAPITSHNDRLVIVWTGWVAFSLILLGVRPPIGAPAGLMLQATEEPAAL